MPEKNSDVLYPKWWLWLFLFILLIIVFSLAEFFKYLQGIYEQAFFRNSHM